MGVYAILLMFIAAALATMAVVPNNVYAGITEWKSEYSVGILEQEPSNFDLNLKITTYDETSIKLDWEKSPTLTKVIGYKIMRKTINSGYEEMALLNSKQTSFIDRNLPDGYYGYKILPNIDSRLDKPTKHGLARTNDLFKTYVKGQEILAKETLRQSYPDYCDPPFQEINNIKWYDFPELDKRQNPQLQKIILKEISKAEKTFSLLISKY